MKSTFLRWEVDDIGGGMPLYKDFGSEDWTLMTLCPAAQGSAFSPKQWEIRGEIAELNGDLGI